MKNISIKKISTYGFLVLIFGSIISAFTLIFLLFKLENIKEDFSLVQDTHNSFLQVKTDTQKLLTTDNIEVANGVLKLSIDRFNTNLNTINLVNRNSILEINNLWYICQKELILIDKILSKPIFSPKNTKNKPLLHRRGELFFQDTSTKFYLLLTEVTNSIEYLLQNEVFILEIFEKINNEQKIYEEAELKNIKNYAIYLPLFILIITIILAISISRIATNIEKRLIVSNREQNQLLALFDGGDSALFKWNNDDNWSVAYVSKSVESFFGYSEKEFLDGSVVYASLIHKEDINQVTVEVGDALKNNTEYFELIPYRVVTKSGKIKWVIDHTVLVKDDNGDVINFIGFITDISELRQKEQMLFQQSKMAAMGEMIGNIAHQWRQPIAIIAMWANNIIADIDMDEIENEDLRRYANNITEQTNHLSQTVDDFRNFFIPNKEKTIFTLKSSIDKTMNLLTASFKTHNIEVIENIEDITITALENELTQAVLNIIKNSKDILVTLPKGDRRLIFINIYKKDNKAVIEIKDSGGGVPKDIIDKVFEPYFTTKHKSQGTGIGLYMTESIINKHLNGKIFVKNVEYEYDGGSYIGANFSIKIPIK